MAAAPGAVMATVPKRGEITQVAVRDDHYIPSPTAVAAVRASAGNVSLTPEADAAVATGPRLDMNRNAVVQHDAQDLSRNLR